MLVQLRYKRFPYREKVILFLGKISPANAHGTHTGYKRDRCRCEECVSFWNEYRKLQARQERAEAKKYRQIQALMMERNEECLSSR